MRVLGGFGMLLLAYLLAVVGVTVGLIASVECLMCDGSNDLSVSETLGFFGLPIAFAMFVAFVGARLITRNWKGTLAVIGGWMALPLLLIESSA